MLPTRPLGGQRQMHRCAVRLADTDQVPVSREERKAEDVDADASTDAQPGGYNAAQLFPQAPREDVNADAGASGDAEPKEYTAAQLFPQGADMESAELREERDMEASFVASARAAPRARAEGSPESSDGAAGGGSGSASHLPLLSRFADRRARDGDRERREDQRTPRVAAGSRASAARRTPLADWERQRFAELLRPLHSRLSGPNESAFGSSVTHGWERFARRNRLGGYGSSGRFMDDEDGSGTSVQVDWAGRDSLGRGRRSIPFRTIGAQSEGTTLEGVDPVQLRQGVDDAQAAIDNCCSVVEVWQWAQVHVFGVQDADQAGKAPDSAEAQMRPTQPLEEVPEGVHDSAASPLALGGEGEDSGSSAERDALVASSDPRPSEPIAMYGVSTPFYGPVLVRLVTTLRERYHAPGAALGVMQAMKMCGPASIALGSTPELYAEALSTRWDVLGDLQGAYEVVVNARSVGVLSSAASTQQYRKTSRDSTRDVGQDQEKRLRQMIERTSDQARKLAIRYVRTDSSRQMQSSPPQGSSALIEPRDKAGVEQLKICDAMDKLVGRSQGDKRISAGGERRHDKRNAGRSPPRRSRSSSGLFS